MVRNLIIMRHTINNTGNYVVTMEIFRYNTTLFVYAWSSRAAA